MNDDQTFDRNARLWLENGPAHVPTRVVDAALRTIAAKPQQRTLRTPRMPQLRLTQSRLAFAAGIAVAVIALGGSYLLLRNSQSQVAFPAPSSTATPNASFHPLEHDSPSPSRSTDNSPSPVSIESLQSMWASVGTRSAPSGLMPFGQVMNIDQAGLRIDAFSGEITSPASISAATGALILQVSTAQASLDANHWDCHTGDSGTYGLTLSPDDQTLTLTSSADDCATREAILSGSWTRWPCKLNYGGYAYCPHLDEQTTGRHVSSIFKPFAGGESGQFAWTAMDSGWVTLSKPPTWPDPYNTPSGAWLYRPGTGGYSVINAVGVFSDLVPSAADVVPVGTGPFGSAPAAKCSDGVHAARASDIADWLESLPYLAASNRTQVTIGGLSGVQLDVSLRAGFVDRCSKGFASSDGTFESSKQIQIFDDLANPIEAIYLSPDSGAHSPWSGISARLIVLDTGDAGGHLVIEIPSPPDGSSFEALIAEAMPLINSFEFTR